jgi:hypothetical protein
MTEPTPEPFNETVDSRHWAKDPVSTADPRHWSKDPVSTVFLIPVRDRQAQMAEFIRNTPPYLDRTLGPQTWEIWFIQDVETERKRPFNKGALFNIGFLELKARFPLSWESKVLVMHDVDVYVKLETDTRPIEYTVSGPGVIRHPYGEIDPRKGPIMGCFSIIYACDYARVNGVPNYYGWGVEDVTFGYRCQAADIQIDESGFIPRYSDPRIYDEVSHRTPADLTYIRACHDRNQRLMQSENFAKPVSGISTVKYTIVSSYAYQQASRDDNRVRVFDVKFQAS